MYTAELETVRKQEYLSSSYKAAERENIMILYIGGIIVYIMIDIEHRDMQ